MCVHNNQMYILVKKSCIGKGYHFMRAVYVCLSTATVCLALCMSIGHFKGGLGGHCPC